MFSLIGITFHGPLYPTYALPAEMSVFLKIDSYGAVRNHTIAVNVAFEFGLTSAICARNYCPTITSPEFHRNDMFIENSCQSLLSTVSAASR